MVNAEAFELDEEEPVRRVLVFDGSSVVESADCVPPRSCWSSRLSHKRGLSGLAMSIPAWRTTS